MLHYKVYENGNLFGTEYTFPNRGDGLAMHDHEYKWRHNVMCVRGSCQVYGPEKKWKVTLKSGEIFDMKNEHHPHEIVALETDTKIINMLIFGRQDYYQVFANQDLEGTNDTPVTIPLED